MGRTIDDWYLDRGSCSADDRADDDAPDRGPDAWLDRAVGGSDRNIAPLGIKSKRAAQRRQGKAGATATSAAVRRAPKPSVRELESEIAGILRSKTQESVQKVFRRKGGGWARLTSKEISLAVRRVQPRLKRAPESRARVAVAASPKPAAIRPPLEEVRRAVLHIHARRPLWATWEISRYFRSLGWSDVSTDRVRSILPLPGMPIPGTESPAVLRHRTKPKKEWIGPTTRQALGQPPIPFHSSTTTKSNGATPPRTHQSVPKRNPRAAEFCPSCGVRISTIGSCRCS
jgi:hypothetical protein